MPYTCARWVQGGQAVLEQMKLPSWGSVVCLDAKQQPIVLFTSPWEIQVCQKDNPEVTMLELG